MSAKLSKVKDNIWEVTLDGTNIGTIYNSRSGFGWQTISPYTEKKYRHDKRKDAVARLVRIAELAQVPSTHTD